jgi:hypothetical protein
MEIDIANVLEEPAQAVELEGGGWQVRLVASLWACGTFLHEYADADEAINDGVLLFPGWPDENGDGWAFSQTDYAEVEGVEPTGRERAAENRRSRGAFISIATWRCLKWAPWRHAACAAGGWTSRPIRFPEIAAGIAGAASVGSKPR